MNLKIPGTIFCLSPFQIFNIYESENTLSNINLDKNHYTNSSHKKAIMQIDNHCMYTHN